jgi:hypothetical protein
LDLLRRRKLSGYRDPVDSGSVGPQAFEVVITACFFEEDVHNKPAEVHKDPATFVEAFNGERSGATGRLYLLFDRVGEERDQARVRRAYDHEHIGDSEGVAHIEHENIVGLFVVGGASGNNGKPMDVIGRVYRPKSLAIRRR